MSNLKTFLLMGVMTFLLMLIGNLIGGSQGVYFAFIFAAFTNFISYWYSDKIVLSMYRAKPAGENSDVYRIVKNLTEKAGMPMPKVYTINESQPNAFATGRNPKHAAVAVTTGLLNIMDDNELAGVIGHELGHVKHRDILIGKLLQPLLLPLPFLQIWQNGLQFLEETEIEMMREEILLLLSVLQFLLLLQLCLFRCVFQERENTRQMLLEDR